MRKNCSSDREKLLKFEAESREFSKLLRSLEQFIQTVKGQNNFWNNYNSNWKKILGFRNLQEKLENVFISIFVQFVPSLVYLLNWNRQVREIWPTFPFLHE